MADFTTAGKYFLSDLPVYLTRFNFLKELKITLVSTRWSDSKCDSDLKERFNLFMF